MPVSDLHREVAAVALRAAARHGFALSGGSALIAPGQRLDRLGDDRFARYGLTQEEVTRLRERFAAWPRTSDAVPGGPGGGRTR
jgi:hypothetical protein